MSSWPPEFFTPAELATLLGTPQRSRQLALLEQQRVPFIRTASGRPLVYRDKLLPAPAQVQNDEPEFDYDAARAPRKAQKRPQPRPAAKAAA